MIVMTAQSHVQYYKTNLSSYLRYYDVELQLLIRFIRYTANWSIPYERIKHFKYIIIITEFKHYYYSSGIGATILKSLRPMLTLLTYNKNPS
jgi:hypothetical protein